MKQENMKPMTIYLDKKDALDFKIRCDVEGKRMTQIIRELIKVYMEHYQRG